MGSMEQYTFCVIISNTLGGVSRDEISGNDGNQPSFIVKINKIIQAKKNDGTHEIAIDPKVKIVSMKLPFL